MGAPTDASSCVMARGAMAASAAKVSDVADDRRSSPEMDQVGASVMDVEQKESLLRNWAMESCEVPFQVPPTS